LAQQRHKAAAAADDDDDDIDEIYTKTSRLAAWKEKEPRSCSYTALDYQYSNNNSIYICTLPCLPFMKLVGQYERSLT